MSEIKKIEASEVLDSRGNPTVSVRVILEDGSSGEAAVPSGASTGTHEALELRDGGERYNGFGVKKAVENINTKINESLVGVSANHQREVDEVMISLDGTENKSVLGANAILGVSLAVARAVANSLCIPLFKYLRAIYEADGVWQDSLITDDEFESVTPFMNIINGGKHADNNVDVQETMIVPKAETFAEELRMGSEVYHFLKKVLNEKGLLTTVGDEGGFAPNLESNIQAMELIVEAMKRAGYTPGKDVFIALDIAASELYLKDDGGKYFLKSENIALSSHQLVGLYADWIKEFPICSIEDGLAEDDFEGWKIMTEKLGKDIQLIGDDLFVTNKTRIEKGIKEGMANSVLIKPNQIGTLTETFEAIKTAKENNYKVMISHRSGETPDTFIADLAVAVSAGQIKSGAPARGERVAKYNRLLEIENGLDHI